MVLTDWVYWYSFGNVGPHRNGAEDEAFHNAAALHEDVVLVAAGRLQQKRVGFRKVERYLTVVAIVKDG